MNHFPIRLRHSLWLLGAALVTACGGGSDSTDVRSGDYTAYAANGQQLALSLDFDRKRYTFRNVNGGAVAAEGSFSEGDVAGTFVFKPPGGPGETARFRPTEDLVVGSFSSDGQVQPFVAARRFVRNLQDAAGTYNHLGVDHTANGFSDSAIQTSRIQGDVLQVCVDAAIRTVDQCPPASLRSYGLVLTGDTFEATPIAANQGPGFSFQVARAGTEKIVLQGAAVAGSPGAFRIGLTETAVFGSGPAWGASVLGEWVLVNYNAGNYSSGGTAPNGMATSFNGSMTGLGAGGPAGIRNFEGGRAFVVANTQVVVLVGARNSDAAGYLQISSK